MGPKLLGFAREVDSRVDVACVLANVEYETWFAAAAESLAEYLDLDVASPPVGVARGGAARESRGSSSGFRGATRYSETRDQPAMTRAMDLALCRGRAPSFDKLCRDLEQRLRQSGRGRLSESSWNGWR